MEPVEHPLDVLYRLRERYGLRVKEDDPGAAMILTAIDRLIDEHEKLAADVARRRLGTSRGGTPPA